jgi:FkbM family methyltransferase
MPILKKIEKSNLFRTLKVKIRRAFGKELRLEIIKPPKVTAFGDWGVLTGKLNNSSIVYSLGVGDDIKLDKHLIRLCGCNVYAFDPTVKSPNAEDGQTDYLKKFKFYQWAVMGEDRTCELFRRINSQGRFSGMYTFDSESADKGESIKVQALTISSIMDRLKHSKIDLLKIDIEGAEYQVINKMLDDKIYPEQLLIEFHHRFEGLNINDSKGLVERLKNCGYYPFYVSVTGREVSFQCLNP